MTQNTPSLMTKIAWKISLPSVLKEQADHTIVATICGLEVPISRGPWHDTRLDHRQRSEGNPCFSQNEFAVHV